MTEILYVAAGGAIGAVARHAVGAGTLRLSQAGWLPDGWPNGTFAVNVLGGLAMGLVVSWVALRAGGSARGWTLFLAVGVLGGFTTFSAFSLELVRMLEARSWGLAMGYAAGSTIVSVLAVMAGLWVGRRGFA